MVAVFWMMADDGCARTRFGHPLGYTYFPVAPTEPTEPTETVAPLHDPQHGCRLLVILLRNPLVTPECLGWV